MTGAYHRPVLLDEVCTALLPPLRQATAPSFLDCTCGGGGHTRAIAEALAPDNAGGPTPRIVALDRDPSALAFARSHLPTWVELQHTAFSQLGAALDAADLATVTAILADLGVSSHQLETPERGFSFQHDAPLDMRMDPTHGVPLAELLPSLDIATLTQVLRDFGDEPDASRIARGIVAAAPKTTRALAEVVRACMSAPQLRRLGLRIHPATRTFQALRIFVNHELDELGALLRDAPERLAPGGRLGIITFHSLEDRRVKHAFHARSHVPAPPRGLPLRAEDMPVADFVVPHEFRHGLIPSPAEVAHNPRSRSSRLRVLERRA